MLLELVPLELMPLELVLVLLAPLPEPLLLRTVTLPQLSLFGWSNFGDPGNQGLQD
jgi:hypothetical protein